MSGFASLKPALTVRLTFNPPVAVGATNKGFQLQVAQINGGTIKSEPGFTPEINAEILAGSDHITVEPDFKHMRVNVKAVCKTMDGSGVFNYTYKGIVEVDPENMSFLTGAPDAKTTQFGSVFTAVNFVTGAQQLKALENGQFVGCSRFVIEPGQAPVVESKISKAIYKPSSS